MAWCSQRREYPQTVARYRLSGRRAAQGTQQNLSRSCTQSDTVQGLWNPASIRKLSANSGNYYEKNLNGCKSKRKYLKNWRACSVVTRHKPTSILRRNTSPTWTGVQWDWQPLSRMQRKPGKQVWQVVQYASRSLTDTESKWLWATQPGKWIVSKQWQFWCHPLEVLIWRLS